MFYCRFFPQARETLAEIPDQFLGCMKKYNIKPNPPPLRHPQSTFIGGPQGNSISNIVGEILIIRVVSSYKKSRNYVRCTDIVRVMCLFLLKHEIIVFCGLYKYYTILNV